jgi:ACS family hexuronate transporter-like MFS transporter
MSGTGLSRRQAWVLAIAATLTMAVSYADRQTLAVLAPTVTRALGISEAQYGWLAAAFSLAYLVGSPIAGRIVDAVGARRGLPVAVVLWSVVAALHAIVPGFLSLFALRIALGLTEAPSFPGAAQTVQRALPPADRARGFGVLFTGSSLGAMLAAPLATAVEAAAGFRAAFLVTAAVGLLWLPLWLLASRSAEARRALDPAPSAIAAEGTTPRPSPFGVALHPAVLRAVAAILASSPVIAFLLLWSAKYLVAAEGLTQSDVGRYLWLPPLLFDVGAILYGHLASRRQTGTPRLLVATAAALCASIGLLPAVHGAWSVTVLAGIALAGGGGLFAVVLGDTLARVPQTAVSTAGGVIAAAQSLAYVVANPLIGWSVGRSGGYAPSAHALAAWVVPGCLVWLLWAPPPRVAESAPA